MNKARKVNKTKSDYENKVVIVNGYYRRNPDIVLEEFFNIKLKHYQKLFIKLAMKGAFNNGKK